MLNERLFNVVDFGAVSDGATIVTKAVQKAIDTANEEGGGTVVFPEGEYVLFTVFLKSNVKIEITKGAKILGAPSFYDYAPEEKIDYPIYQDSSHTYFDCSMFVGRDCENIAICGEGDIDMRSVWDEDNVRNIVHRGPKCIALRNCRNVIITGLGIYNVTDLAVYFAGCENVEIGRLRMRVYIDAISPDNSKRVYIHDNDIECGDDGIVFKSSYTLNKIDICEDITVRNCRVKSRCSAVKFGTETNGGFHNILIENIEIYETRITAIAIESVDGAIIDGVTIKNVRIRNAGAPLFIHIGKRMRGPEGREIGQIKNIHLENIVAEGPYEIFDIIEWNYASFSHHDTKQYPWVMKVNLHEWVEPFTPNVCGLKNRPLENITLKNVRFVLQGGVQEYSKEVPDDSEDYPEVMIYGRTLPAKGIYFRHINGLTLDNVTVETYKDDRREDFVFEDVSNLTIK